MNTRKYFFIVLSVLITLSFSHVIAQDKVGVLVLAHGGSDGWNETVIQAAEPLKEKYPVQIAFGMADPNTMQAGIDKLEAQGVTKIIVAQLFISSYSPIIRQNEYLLGIRKELADEPMLMDHSSGNHSQHHQTENKKDDERKELKLLKLNSKIILTEPLNDNPLAANILLERIMELSKLPENETVIIVSHGPNDEEDNKKWIETMDSIANHIRVKLLDKQSFKNIFCMTVRDDAPKEIYEIAKENLRNIINQASKDGKVIVVPLLLSQGGVEKGIVKRLEGLNYEWNGKTLLPQPNITSFLQTSIDNALKETKF